jgi:hypothetical protein
MELSSTASVEGGVFIAESFDFQRDASNKVGL